MQLYIKNMVCPRCIAAVEQTFSSFGYEPLDVALGEVKIKETIPSEQLNEIADALAKQGFELLDDQKKQIIIKIKSIIIEEIQKQDQYTQSYSELIANNLNKEYSSLSKLFSSTEGITIEQYIILQKIEKVKELLVYDELSLSEISYKLGYSSVAHLSAQFKKVIGLTPSEFKKQGRNLRRSIDSI